MKSASASVATNKLVELQKYGQSVWLDYIRRSLLVRGDFQRLVDEDGVRGVTSNPAIFEMAIDGSNDYDEAIRLALASDPGTRTSSLYESLVTHDIRMAANTLRRIYDETEGADGFVSLEVSPHLAHDTEGTIAEAQRLWKEVDRPNLMIKVPATPEGALAIEKLIGLGINVNVTLLFSLNHYEAVAHAYLRGLEQCPDSQRVASVASFFVSRIDTVVDRALEAIHTPEALSLKGRIAIANARMAYQRYREIFEGQEFAQVQSKRPGARVQRVLWASTGTKNPAYSDVLYVQELIGQNTINTMPPATLNAFRDHGQPRPTLPGDVEQARTDLSRLAELGIDLNGITEQLLAEGVAAFTVSYEKLLAELEKKRHFLFAARLNCQLLNLAEHQARVEQRIGDWQASGLAGRLWRKDPSVWSSKTEPDITDRLGWLTLPETMHEQVHDLALFAAGIREEGMRHVVLLGMGGSSLAPEVFQATFGNAPGYPELTVLDSTHPDAVRAIETKIDLSRTLFLVSSKSGTTIEPLSFFHYFWKLVSRSIKSPGARFAAVTDPGTPLVKLAAERGFRSVFQATPDVGGRYSALTAFGLVPAASIGVDLNTFIERSWTMSEACASCRPASENPGLILGAALGELSLAGRDKVTFLTTPSLSAFPSWAEQLIAESTGKDGKGIVPIASEPLGRPEIYGGDRVFVHLSMEKEKAEDSILRVLQEAGHPVIQIRLADKADLGQEFFRWEFAVAAAGAVLGIHPFNQPDVELAKQLAREAMKSGSAAEGEAAATVAASRFVELRKAVKSWLGSSKPGDYIGIQAYLAPTKKTAASLGRLQQTLRDVSRLATTLGYGPRFLHSTGQLHKGGPNSGLFLQLVDEPEEPLPVPETDYTFGGLIRAQALGDYQALTQRKRRVLRVSLGRDVPGGLKRLLEAVAK